MTNELRNPNDEHNHEPAVSLQLARNLLFVRFERERRRRDDEAASLAAKNAERLRGAELTARMRSWTADIIQIRDMRHKGFVEALQMTADGSD